MYKRLDFYARYAVRYHSRLWYQVFLEKFLDKAMLNKKGSGTLRKILLIVILSCTTISVLGQGFPWDIFKPRTLKEVMSITTKEVRPDDSMFLATNQLESKVMVTFTGQSRPMTKGNSDFLRVWAGMLDHPKDYPLRYDREYLYKEGDDEYWLATQKPITKYFDKELKPGDKMALYLISIGAYRDTKSIQVVLLVEEFQKAD